MSDELATFTRERNEALLSLDEAKIRAHHAKWSPMPLPTDPHVFWGAIHKAITGIKTFPIEFRRSSKAWLDQRGLGNYGDGEL